MKLRLKAVVLFIYVLFFGQAQAQKAILFNHLSMENGLSQNSVMAITQDKNQFIWFGTRGGLNRYDGYRFKVYTNNENPNTISDNVISCLITSYNGSVIAGAESGLNFYNQEKDNFVRVTRKSSQLTLSNDSVECLFEDSRKDLWVGTFRGLNLLIDKKNYRFKTFYFAKPESNASLNNILSIYEDKNRNLWVGTGGGLVRMYLVNGKYRFEIIKHNPKTTNSISSNYVRTIIGDTNDRLWIGTDNGLNVYQYNKRSFSRFQKSDQNKNSLINNDIRKVMFDKTGKLWIGTQEGVSILDTLTKNFSNYKHDPDIKGSLSQNSSHSIFQDRGGSIYVGTYHKGVNVLYPYSTNFNIYANSKSTSSVSNNIISAIVEDKSYNLWIGTEGGGLNYFDRSNHTFVHYFANPNTTSTLSTNLIKSLFLAKDGNLIVGTHRGGLFVFNPLTKKFKRIINIKNQQREVGTSEIIALLEDSFGTVWVGSRNGLSTVSKVDNKYPDTTVKSPVEKLLKDKYIQVLFEDNFKNIWIGTMKGLFSYVPKTGKVNSYFKKSDLSSLQADRINCIIQTKKGEICIGTYLGGLSIYNPKTNRFKTYTQKDGLPNNNVLGIIEDEENHLWLSTDKGISKMEISKGKFINYTKSDGLSGNDFNYRSFFKDHSGQLFFGGFDGITSFYANQIQANHQIAPITFTGLRLFNEPVRVNGADELLSRDLSVTKHLTFKHNHNNFSLEFALLNYIKPEKNSYSYKLIGYNKDWVSTQIPSVSYANLLPGSYTFMVKGINNDGQQGGTPASIEIEILPPFWATWWAYLFYFLLFSGVLFLIIRYIFVRERLKRTEDMQRMKLDFFTYIAHEIRTPLTLIIAPLENLLNQSRTSPELHKQILPIKHNADRLIRLVTELLDFRKAETNHLKLHVSEDNIVDFIAEIHLSFAHIAQERQINYQFVHDSEQINLFFDKIQLEKVLFNLLSNAFKFTPNNGEIIVSAVSHQEEVEINISDSGKGIPFESQPKLFTDYFQVDDQDPNQMGSGIGLVLSKIIMLAHHGTITFVSTPSQNSEPGSTTFTVKLKKGKSHFKPENFDLQRDQPQTIPRSALPPEHKLASIDAELDIVETTKKQKPASKETILIVEDNAEIRLFVSNLISNHYKVDQAVDGHDGWEMAIKVLPELIICDVMMPKMDGIELCRRLKLDERTSHIPIIILTARSSHIHHVSGLETGADLYITKPFSPELLLLNIRNLLTSRIVIRQRFLRYSHLETADLSLNATDEAFMTKIINYIEKHLVDEDFGVSELASEVGMSRPILYKKIRMLTDLSVNDFIKSIRLKKARALFTQKRYTIYEVSYQVGFNDPKYFSREFKKQFGESPKDMMNRLAGE